MEEIPGNTCEEINDECSSSWRRQPQWPAMAQAVKASGVLVRIAPAEFYKILDRAKEPLIVHAQGGVSRPSINI